MNSTQTLIMNESKHVVFNYTYTDDNELLLSNARVSSVSLLLNNMDSPIPNDFKKPTGYDEWAGFYDAYIVNKVEIECTFINTGNQPIIVGVACLPENINTSPGGITWTKLKNFPSNNFVNKQAMLTANNGSVSSTTINIECDLAELSNLKSQYSSSVKFSSKFDLFPPESLNGIIYAINSENVAAPIGTAATFKLNIKFYTTVFQVKLLV